MDKHSIFDTDGMWYSMIMTTIFCRQNVRNDLHRGSTTWAVPQKCVHLIFSSCFSNLRKKLISLEIWRTLFEMILNLYYEYKFCVPFLLQLSWLYEEHWLSLLEHIFCCIIRFFKWNILLFDCKRFLGYLITLSKCAMMCQRPRGSRIYLRSVKIDFRKSV